MGGEKKRLNKFFAASGTLGGYYFNKFLLESTLYAAFFYQAKEGPGTENKKVLENACGVRDSEGETYVSIYT